MNYIKPEIFDPSKSLRVKNWTNGAWTHSFPTDHAYIDEKGNSRQGNTRREITIQPGEEMSFPEGIAHYLATRMAEWSYGRTSKNIAIAPDRDERILKALPDLSSDPVAPVEAPREAFEEALKEPEVPKKAKKAKKVEDDFAGAKPKAKRKK